MSKITNGLTRSGTGGRQRVDFSVAGYVYTVSQKKRPNFETVARNYNDQFDDIWQKYSKGSRTKFPCFSFHVGLLFLSTFRLSNQTPK